MWRACWLVVLVGCPAPGEQIAPDGRPPLPDANLGDGPSSGPSTLTIAWATTPASPGITTGGNQLADVRLRMESLRAIVDVDPNDPDTTVAAYKLHWDDEVAPQAIVFEDAPAGRYTSVVLQLDDGDGEKAFDLRGVDDDSDTFKIDDSSSLSISISCDAVLEPGGERTITIDIDLGAAIDPIDFDDLPPDDGVDHHLDGGDDQMAAFRTRLRQAFRIAD